MSKRVLGLIAVPVASLVVCLLGPPPARAATLTVTNCGDTTPGGGPGQLRKLINDAVGGDTIVVPACTITLTGAAGDDANLSGDLDINKGLTIKGQGAGSTIIDGGGIDRVFHMNAANNLGIMITLEGLTIRNGHPPGDTGGGMLLAAGAFVTVRDSVITGNTSTVGGGGIMVNGGPFGAGASLTLINTTVSDNTGTASSTGGAGIYSSGAVTVMDSTISGNTSLSTIGGAGGIQHDGLGKGVPITLTRSTISGNSAVASGSAGGILITNFATATLTNLTISGNSAPGGGGFVQANGNQLNITNSTITGNTSSANGGLVARPTSTAALKNTILSSNTPQNCTAQGTGAIVSLNPNLDSGNSCGFNSALGDLVNTNPLLGPLQKNGGPTQTHLPLDGSPAIDAGANAGCPATDQRGVPRPLDVLNPGTAVCDLGAVEVETLEFITLGFSLNTATVSPGTSLQGTGTVSNTGTARPLDAYVFLLPPASAGPALGCPGGDAVGFLTSSGATLTCVSSGVQTFTPLHGNVTLSGDILTPLSAVLFNFPWPGAPPGLWLAGVAVTPAGAFSDGRVNPLAGIVVATAPFTATP